MKILHAFILVLSLMGCATDPYRVCYDKDGNASNSCIQQVQQNEQRKAEYFFQNRQAFMLPTQQSNTYQQPYQMPVSRPTQTNCNSYGSQFNCQSY